MELALVLPFFFLLVLAVVQVGLVVRDQVLLTHAAREAARHAAVDPNPAGARQAALSSGPLDPARLEMEVTRVPDTARVITRLSYRSPTAMPVVGMVVPDVVLAATASMRIEAWTSSVSPFRWRI